MHSERMVLTVIKREHLLDNIGLDLVSGPSCGVNHGQRTHPVSPIDNCPQLLGLSIWSCYGAEISEVRLL